MKLSQVAEDRLRSALCEARANAWRRRRETAAALQSSNDWVAEHGLPLDQAPRPAGRLNPVFAIAGQDCIMATQFLSAVPRAMLTQPVATLALQDTQVSNALDMLLVGF